MRSAGLARLAAILLGLAAVAAGARAAEPLRFGFAPPADPAAPPPGWETLTFPRVPRHTRYTVVPERAVAYYDAITIGPAPRE